MLRCCCSVSHHGSREATPTLLDEIQYLRNSTPLREMTPCKYGGDYLRGSTPLRGLSTPLKRDLTPIRQVLMSPYKTTNEVTSTAGEMYLLLSFNRYL